MNSETGIRRFSEQLTTLEKFYHVELDDGEKRIYMRALGDLPIEMIERAVELAFKSCKWMPKPVELRQLVEGTQEDEAATAWDRLQQAYSKAGYWTSVVFEDGAIGEAMARVFGSWQEFCEAMHPVYIAADSLPAGERESLIAERRNPESVERLLQVGGLSPEMIRARQKDFFTAYRAAVREGFGRKPYYARGYSESQNLLTALNRGVPVEINGQKILPQRIYIQGATGRMVDAEFDFYGGQLLTPVPALLERPALRVLPPAQEQKLLTGETELAVSPDESKQFFADAIADLAAMMQMPKPYTGLTPEQIEDRKRELAGQIKALEMRTAENVEEQKDAAL